MLTAVALLIYPLWGVIAPDSYAGAELKHHYAYDSETTGTQIVAASWSLYLSNSVLALSFASFAWYLVHPYRFRWALLGGLGILVFPIFRTASRALMDLQLTSNLNNPNIAISFSTEELLVMLFGVLLIAIAHANRADV